MGQGDRAFDVVEQIGLSSDGGICPSVTAMDARFAQCALGKDLKTIPGMRAFANELVRTVWTRGPTLPHVEDAALEGEGYELKVRIYRPDVAKSEPLPAVIWFHGGWLVMGNLESDDNVCRILAKAAHCCIYNVEYRLAPEHPFPAAHDDAILACRTILNQAPGGPIDPQRVVIAGYSAGGALASAACLAAVNDGWGKPAGQLLLMPVLDFTGAHAAPKRTPEERASADDLLDKYLPDPTTDRVAARLSALGATDLDKMPPSFILTGELDPLRNEAEAYGHKLLEAGVATRMATTLGMPHLYLHLSGDVPNAKVAIDKIAEMLRALFDGPH